ncbi:MAG: sensor histidine kinase, partial [Bacteroidota bacterium]
MNCKTYHRQSLLANHSLQLFLKKSWSTLITLLITGSLLANGHPVDQAAKDFKFAEELFYAWHNDSVLQIVEASLAMLEDADALRTPIALRLRLLRERTIERRQDFGEVMDGLLKIVDDCQAYGMPDVELETQLVLALIHEKMARGPSCKKDLDVALQLVKKHQLDSLFPHLAVRKASYHRFYGTLDSAFYYAERAHQEGELYNQIDAQIDGHMVLGILNYKIDFDKSYYHFREMGKLYLSQENYDGYSGQYSNLASLHFNHGQLEKALMLNDSAIYYNQIAQSRGLDDPSKIGYKYALQAKLLRALGQQDSAWHYLVKSHQLELEASKRNSAGKVAEIEARYADEKKEQQLTQQARLLQEEKKAKQRLIGLVLLVLLFASILAYYYVRLHKANHQLEDQANQIAETNLELEQSLSLQIMLQGEIHHRVKNNLQVIISLLELQAEELTDPIARSRLASMSGRIYSMAAIHEILHRGKGNSLVNLPNYISKICDHFRYSLSSKDAVDIQLDLQEHDFSLETLMPLGIVINELLTNSLKYAVRPDRNLQINVQFYLENDYFVFNYRDNGPGYATGSFTKREGSLGHYLLGSMARQLQGKMVTENDAGAVFYLYFGGEDVDIPALQEPLAAEVV